MKHVGRQSRKLAIPNFKLDIMRKALTTMNVKDTAMKKAIANLFFTVQALKLLANDLIAEDSPLVRKRKTRKIMEQRTPDTTAAPVLFLSISYVIEVIVFYS